MRILPVAPALLFVVLVTFSFAQGTQVSTTYCEFWAYPSWQAGNPYITSIEGQQLWHPAFAKQLDSFSVPESSLASPDDLSATSGLPNTDPGLAAAKSRIQKGNGLFQKAKSNATDARALERRFSTAFVAEHPLIAATAGIGGALLFVPFSPLILWASFFGPDMIDYWDYLNNFASEYSDAFSNAYLALSEYSRAANEADYALAQECDALEHAGAGSAGYSGAASAAMSECRSRELTLLKWEQGSLNVGGETAAGKLARALGDSEALKETTCAQKPKDMEISNPTYSEQVQLLVGTDGVVVSLLQQASRASAAFSKMESEYSGESASASSSISDANLVLQSLRDEQIDKMDYQSISFLNSSGEITVSVSGGTPSGRVFTISQAIRNSSALLAQAGREHAATASENYLANAISSARQSDGIAQWSISECDAVRSDASQLRSQSQLRAEAAIAKAREAINSMPSSGAYAALAKSNAEAKYQEALSKYNSEIGEAKIGTAFLGFVSAARLADEASVIAGTQAGASSSYSQFGACLADFRSAVQSAQKDELDVSAESLLLASYSGVGQGLGAETYLSFCSDMGNASAGILANARAKYYDVQQLHDKAGTLAPYFTDTNPQAVSELASNDALYFEQGVLSYSKALGHLKELRSSYSRALSQFEASYPIVIGTQMSSSALVSYSSETAICLDEQATRQASVLLSNELPFSTAGAVVANVPFDFEVSREDISGTSPNELASVSYSRGMLLLTFSSVSQGVAYEIEFSKQENPARTTSSKQESPFLSQSIADMRLTRTFATERELRSLCAKIALPENYLVRSSSLDERDVSPVSMPEYCSFQFFQISQGNHVLKLEYSIPAPVSISRSSISAEEQGQMLKISYQLGVTSRAADFSGARLSLIDEANSSPMSFSVSSESGPVSGLTYAPTASGISYSFILPVLRKGETRQFSVNYVADNSEAFCTSLLNSLKPQVRALNDVQLNALLAEAESLVASKNWKEASQKLLALQTALQQKLSSRALILQQYSAERLALDSDLSSLNSTISLFRSLNFTDEANSLSSSLSRSLSLAQEADRQLQGAPSAPNAASSPEAALAKLREARKEAAVDVPSLLNSRKKALTTQYSTLKALWLKFADKPELDEQFASLDSELKAASSETDARKLALSLSRAQMLSDSLDSALVMAISSETSRVSSLLDEYGATRTAFDPLLQNYAVQYNALKPSSAKFGMALTPSEISSRLTGYDKSAKKAKDGLAKSRSYVIEKPEEVLELEGALTALHELSNSTSAILDSLRSRASSSLGAAETAISELEAKAPNESDYPRKISAMRADLEASKDAYNKELYADSLTGSEKIVPEASALLSSLAPQQGGNNNILLIAAASLLLIIAVAALFLLRGKGGKGARPSPNPGFEGKTELKKAE